MTTLLRDIVLLVCVGAGMLVVGQVPVLVASYQQQLTGARQELFEQLGAFRTNAEQNNLSLQAFLQKLEDSPDLQIKATAASLRRLVQRLTYLEQHNAALRQADGWYARVFLIIRDGEAEMVHQTLHQHRITPITDAAPAIAGALAGYGLFCILTWLTRRITGRRVQRLQSRRYR